MFILSMSLVVSLAFLCLLKNKTLLVERASQGTNRKKMVFFFSLVVLICD